MEDIVDPYPFRDVPLHEGHEAFLERTFAQHDYCLWIYKLYFFEKERQPSLYLLGRRSSRYIPTLHDVRNVAAADPVFAHSRLQEPVTSGCIKVRSLSRPSHRRHLGNEHEIEVFGGAFRQEATRQFAGRF